VRQLDNILKSGQCVTAFATLISLRHHCLVNTRSEPHGKFDLALVRTVRNCAQHNCMQKGCTFITDDTAPTELPTSPQLDKGLHSCCLFSTKHYWH